MVVVVVVVVVVVAYNQSGEPIRPVGLNMSSLVWALPKLHQHHVHGMLLWNVVVVECCWASRR